MFLLNRTSHEPIYQQLYRQLKAEIETGVRQPGQTVPSSRFLAKQLAISRNTVDHAYQDLVAEGYLVAKAGASYHVPQHLPYLTKLTTPAPQAPKTTELAYDFTESYDQLQLFPKQAWQVAEQAMMLRGVPHIQPANGDWGYRVQLAAFLARLKGIHATPEQIVVTSGFNEAAGIIANLVPELAANRLAVANPIAPNARHVWSRLNVPTVPFTATADPTTFPAATGYLLTPTHDFPTGASLTRAHRQRLAAWAETHHRILIELDTDGTLDYSGRPAPAIMHDLPEQSFYYSNYDDTLGSSLCMGFLVLPQALVARYQAQYGHLPNRNSQWQQRIVSHLIGNGDLERFMRQLTLVYANRRQLLVDTIQNALGAELRPLGAQVGTFIPFQLTGNVGVRERITQATQAGVGLVDPDRCWIDQQPTFPSVIFSFRQVTDEQIIAGVQALAAAWHP